MASVFTLRYPPTADPLILKVGNSKATPMFSQAKRAALPFLLKIFTVTIL